MNSQNEIRVLAAVVVICSAVLLAVSGCKRDSKSGNSEIDTRKLVDTAPEFPAPELRFPIDQRVDDPTVNVFIGEAMEFCRVGDYDGFRTLFGTANQPPDQSRFEMIWKAIKTIDVAKVVTDAGTEAKPKDPAEYYAEVHIYYRKPDREGRTERLVYIRVFEEGGKWRLGALGEKTRERFFGPRKLDKASEGVPVDSRTSSPANEKTN